MQSRGEKKRILRVSLRIVFFVRNPIMVSQCSCQCLEVSQCNLVANGSILTRILGKGQCILCIYNLEYRSFSACISQLCQAQAFCSRLGAQIK